MITGLWEWITDSAHWHGTDGILNRMWEHLTFTLIALLISLVIAIPFGLFVGHTGRGGVVLVGLSNAIRALPTLGLVTFLFLIFLKSVPATIIGLVVLAVPPVLAGVYAGVRAVPDETVDAAQGVGMTGWQRLWKVEVPLALPLALGGIRNATLQIVATAAIAAYVGLGGLGRFLLDGLAILDYSEVIAGAILTALLAIILDLLLAAIQRAVVPRGVRIAAAAATVRKGSVDGDGS